MEVESGAGAPADRAALLARIRELETALEPFARAASDFAGRPPGGVVMSTATASILIADLVAAAAVRKSPDSALN